MNRNHALAAALSVVTFAAAAHAIDRDFTVHNNTGGTIAALHVTPTSVNTWGADLLGRSVLAQGGSVLLHYTPSMYRGQCVFDIRIVEPDGDASVVHGINLCTITDVTFSRDSGGAVTFSTN